MVQDHDGKKDGAGQALWWREMIVDTPFVWTALAGLYCVTEGFLDL